MDIQVFGKEAQNIHEGDIFIASVGEVEGRTVVTLKPKLKWKCHNLQVVCEQI